MERGKIMKMTKGEIIREYRTAKNRQKQIKILADLNCCSETEIKHVLEEYSQGEMNHEQGA